MTDLPSLNLPEYHLRIRKIDNNHFQIFDVLRKRYVALTPEEYVRQRFTTWLIKEKQYPSSLLSNEVSISLNGTLKRCDTVLFRPDGATSVIVEYKAPHVKITQEVFNQIVRYNLVLNTDVMIVSNGLFHYCCYVDKKSRKITFLRKIPSYNELLNLKNNE